MIDFAQYENSHQHHRHPKYNKDNVKSSFNENVAK